MTRPRSQLIVPDSTPYYHCIARCVRRAFLCGDDRYSGRNFDHRKPWLVVRLKLLEEVFAIDIAAYAIMSNHYHLVLHINQSACDSWDKQEVIKRWLKLYKGPLLIQRYLAEEPLTAAEIKMVDTLVRLWRGRLCNISWFMRCLNEHIARKANQEDNCKGRFWEGRFKSQALLDEAALLSCMTYVDLNPIRAAIAKDISSSDYTSVQDRLRTVEQGKLPSDRPRLMPLAASIKENDHQVAVPFPLKDYLELTDWTGRSVRDDKRGFIPAHKPKILDALAIDEQQWLYLSTSIQKQSISMLNGLGRLEKRKKDKKAA